MTRFFLNVAAVAVCANLLFPGSASAHCDTYSGPVIVAAKKALDVNDVTPVLKWVGKEDEERIKAAFKTAVAVRSKAPEFKEFADNYFFETLVRIHRAGEGASYTGLKNEPVERIIAMSDNAIATGAIDSLANKMAAHLRKGISERFTKVLMTQKNAETSVAAGREYVEAYVNYTHYIEEIHDAIMSGGGHHAEGKETNSKH